MAFSDYGLSPCPETNTLLRYMAFPAQGRRVQIIDRMIRDLKGAGIWNKLDVLWVPAAHDSQAALLNWKAPNTFPLTAVNTPTFTKDRGYAGNASTSYLSSAWLPSTAVQASLNSMSMGCYLNAGTDTTTLSVVMGSLGAATGTFVSGTWTTSNSLRGRLSSASSADLSDTTIATNYGLTVLDRSGATTIEGYRNGVAKGNATSASVSLTEYGIYLGSFNSSGSPGGFMDFRFAIAFAGASLTAAQHAALYILIQRYLVAIGGHV